ncbi:MAG: nitroreductase family protein [Kiritimatiellaeota bacterium]|nr:nitroreductase family protein [Kiritimatiellota bacterium]
MDAMKAITTRCSVRKFSPQPVTRAQLVALVEAGRLAPTARNVQPWEFVAITTRPALTQLANLTDTGGFIATAAACLAVFCKDTKYYLEDGCAATANILLAATAQGLGACWVAGDKKPYAPAVARLLGAPADGKLVSLIALGYPAGTVAPPPKRALSDLLHWEKF